MTTAAEEVRRITMAHTDEVFDGHADDAGHISDLQQYSGD